MGNFKFGINMGAITADFEKKPADVLRGLSQIGYKGIEITYPLPLPIDEFNSLTKELDIVPISLHAASPGNDDEINKMIDFVQSINCERIVFGSYHPDNLKSADHYKSQAELFNKTGEKCKKRGIQAFYHNHHWEFKKFDGKYGLDIMMEETKPDWVQFEIDVCWLTVGGADPSVYIRKNEKRCRLIHYKDIFIKDGFARDGHAKDGIIEEDGYSLKEGSYALTEAGTGVVDFKKIREIVNPQYVDWLISEQDNSTLPPMETARINYENYKRLGVI